MKKMPEVLRLSAPIASAKMRRRLGLQRKKPERAGAVGDRLKRVDRCVRGHLVRP